MARDDEKTSYLKEMLLEPASTYGFLGALSLGALLSLPLGIGVGMLPVLGFVAAEGIAALFIPSSPKYRAKVDARKRKARREQTRAHLIEEIESRESKDAGRRWTTYHRMVDRLSSLSQTAKNQKSTLSQSEVERLDDATLKYLGLWLGRLVLDERKQSVADSDLFRRLAAIDHQLETAQSSSERRKLQKAKEDLERIMKRRKSLETQEASLDAAMLVIADTFEEVYQQIITNPTSSDITRQLEEAVERMRIEDDLDHAVEEELEDLFRSRAGATQKKRAHQ